MIKIENPEWVEFQQMVALLRSAKVQLEKITPKAQDLGAKLKQAKVKDVSLVAKSDSFEKALKALVAFGDELRDYIVSAEYTESGEEPEKLKDMMKMADLLKEKAIVPNTGMKQMMSTNSAILS